MDYEIARASPRHIRPMAKRMRGAHAMTLGTYGFDPRRALHDAYLRATYARVALIGGHPVAMWGLQGPLLGDAALVWMVMSDEIAHLSFTIVREARRELADIMEHYSEVATTVLPDDEAAIRFAAFLGFHDDDDDLEDDWSEVAQRIRSEPKHRIPIGDSYVIALGYHGGRRCASRH